MRRVSSLMVTFALVAALLVSGPQPAVAQSTRYLDPIFSDVDVTYDIVYGQAVNNLGVLQDLTLDFYEPVGDTETERPLIVWVHGGSFVSGDKSSMAYWANEFAKRGYATASINYRLQTGASWEGTSLADVMNDPVFLTAVYRAFADANTAVKYFRANATTYEIDIDKIVGGGYSAGATTALNMGSWPFRSQGEGTYLDPGYVTATVSLAGLTSPGLIEHGEPPVFMAHGTSDPVVSYSEATSYCNAANAEYVPCTMLSLPGVGHSLPNSQIRDQLAPWLYANVINEPPFIESMSLHSGLTTGGETVTLTGRGFETATAVTFGGIPASFTIESNHQITAIAPPRWPAALVNARVVNPSGTSVTFAPTWWSYVPAPVPTVGLVNPTVGPTTGGTAVSITGSGFTGATAVKFGTVPAASFTVNSPTSITAVTPPNAPNLNNVYVTAPSGTSAAVAWKTWFLFQASGPPVITGAVPLKGPSAGGNVVTISGWGFTGTTSVRFSVTEATSFVVESDTRITAVAPARPPGLVNVYAAGPNGTSVPTAPKTWYQFQ